MKVMMVGTTPPVLVFVLCAAVCIFGLFQVARAQNQTQQATTDPAEVRALNSIFQKWGISADSSQWNKSGEPCSGAAINESTAFDDTGFNPLIICDCSYNNGSTCHITQLKVDKLNVVGVIPEELWTLTFLTNLNLGQNYNLTSSLSASIGNLTRLQYLNLHSNALSGELPKELGYLTDLIVLEIGGNNFSGSLPSELGNLRNLESMGFGTNNFSGPLSSEIGNLLKLEQFTFDSSGVSGEIPSTFANLQNLQRVWASDTELTGRIPDFIGNWTKLTFLRFQGNSFEGPIPLTFSRLTSLMELRISDLSNGSSSLAFIRDMKNLVTLELRNSDISDSIPSNIGEYQSLQHLDLSFNKISGQIPDALFSLSLLTYLSLGNNNLNGSLPEQKSSSLYNIDLSYNNLAGSFPNWVNTQGIQLNLVANNFTIESSSSSVLLSGLNCLQRNFPCNRGHGIYYNFGINCGGPQITSSTGILYDKDNEAIGLGPANYYVANANRWAVSNVGYFSGSNSRQYISSSLSQFANISDKKLFQTARLSASSLRYYGLGLENGNYTVSLQFAETTIINSIGRRVFDIYIQGNLVRKDFDIRKEAGGVSFRAIQKQFINVPVSENYLEIHLFWAGKGTCCTPATGIYGPSISAISATPDFTPTVDNKSPSSKKNRTGLIVGILVGAGVVSFLTVSVVFYNFQRRKQPQTNDDEEIAEPLGIEQIGYAELKTATEDFNPANKLGEGGFGPVYKGTLNNGRVIAVKQLSVTSHQGKNQFVTEIATISAVQHRNLVKLYGCCIEGDKRLLVYEYLENKSLDQALFGKRSLNLEWPRRYGICLGVARGLAYLHEESRLRIVHRDVKASNILLDSDLNPKISDFGLAKLYDDKKTHISTRVAGTIGYLAPEYAMRGHLTEKADVFAFGVVALELVSGRPNSDSSLEEEKKYLLEWAWNLHENKHEVDLVDSELSEFNEEEVKRVIGVSLLCTRTSPTLRPSMSRVVAMLSGDIEVSTVTTRPGYLTDWKFDDDVSSLMSDITTQGTDTSYCNSSTSATMTTGAENSPVNVTKPMLPETVKEGW